MRMSDFHCIARVKELKSPIFIYTISLARVSVDLILIHVLPVGLSRVGIQKGETTPQYRARSPERFSMGNYVMKTADAISEDFVREAIAQSFCCTLRAQSS